MCWSTLFPEPECDCEKNVVFKVLYNCVAFLADFEKKVASNW